MEEKIALAISEIVKVIYFADNADYLSGLWSALNRLDPEAAKLLEEDERAAFDKYADP